MRSRTNFFLIVLVVSFLISIFVHTLDIKVSASVISIFADLVTIIGIIGLLIAYADFIGKKKKEREQRLKDTLHAIRAIKYELEVIGVWTAHSAEGYHLKDKEKWIEEQKTERGNPFHFVYDIDSSALQHVNILSATSGLGDKINEAIAWLNQWIISFNSTLREIREFKYSRNSIDNVALGGKLDRGTRYEDLNPEEKAFSDRLVEMYVILHFVVISDESGKRLFYWHQRLKTLLEEKEKKTNYSLRNF